MNIYVDGGCSRSNQKNQAIREMIMVVYGEKGVITETREFNGSNNIAELKAILLALMYIKTEGISEATIYSDSQVAIYWATGSKPNKNINNPEKVKEMQKEIKKLLQNLEIKFKWIKRDNNLAGQYIESKYQL